MNRYQNFYEYCLEVERLADLALQKGMILMKSHNLDATNKPTFALKSPNHRRTNFKELKDIQLLIN